MSWEKLRSGWKRAVELRTSFVQVLLYSHNLENIPACEAPKGCSVVTLQPFQEDQLGPIWAESLDIARHRLQRGDRCYIVMLYGQPAHYSWVQTSGVHPLSDAGRKVAIATNELWIYHCFTATAARGLRLYPLTLTRILRDYKVEGFRRAWIYTTQTNHASQRGIDRADFTWERNLRAFRCAGLTVPL